VSWEDVDSDGHDYYDVNYNKNTTTTALVTIATTTATGASGIQPPPLVVVPTPQSTAAANGQIRQIGALQIATWALVGVAAFLLAYLLSGFVLSRKQ